MKAIIFVALLVVFAQGQAPQTEVHTATPAWAVPLKHIWATIDPTQNFNGFADEMNFNETIRSAGKACVDAINKGFHTIVQIVQKGKQNLPLLALESVGVLETVKTEVTEVCEPYTETLKKYFEENRVPLLDEKTSSLEAVQSQKMVIQGYSQQFAWEALDAFINKKPYDYGRIQGKSFKLAGNFNWESRVNQYTQFNSTKTRPENYKFNMTEFSEGFWTGYLESTGNSEKLDVNDFIKCGDGQMTIKSRIEEIQKNTDNTFLGRMKSKIQIAEEIAKLGSDCWVEVKVMLPIWKKIKADPVKTLVNLYHGSGLQAGQISWLMAMFMEDVQKTDYLLAGKAMGTAQKLQTRDI